MSAATATKQNAKTAETREQELLRTHRQLVAEYPATVGAAKAQISRKLNLVQMELDLIGSTYDFWEKPDSVITRSYLHSPEQLVERIAGLRRLMAREDRPEVAKATADRELTAALAQAEKRGIEVPDAS